MTHAHVLALPRRSAIAGGFTLVVLLAFALALPALARADEPSYVVHNATASLQNPDVSGDLFVWEENANNGDIWARGGGGTAFPVVQLSSYQTLPAVDGTTVVWQDDRANAGVYRIRGATVNPLTGGVGEFAISSVSGSDTDPDVSGRFVVWTRQVGTSYDIYGYDLLTSTQFPICTNASKQDQPAISGDLVVWRDYRNSSNPDVYGARIGLPGYTISEIAVRAQGATGNSVDGQPAVHGSTVAWYDGRSGAVGIYAATVTGITVSGEWKVSTLTRSVSSPSVNGTLIAWTYSGGTSGDDIYARRTDKSPEWAIASTNAYEKTCAVGASRTVWTNTTGWDICAADVGGFGWSAGITVNAGAASTTSRNVTLTLSGTSSVGVATDMAFSNNGTDWSGWEAYATSRAFALPAGDGTKTVYVKYRDAESNVSPVKSDAILLDENAPVTDDDAPAGWSTGDVTVTLTPDDGAGSGVLTTVCDVDGKGVDTYRGPIPVSGDGIHTIGFASTDNLGQNEQWKTVQVWIDGTAPTTTDNAGADWHPGGWVLQLDPYDAMQLDRTEFSINGGPWQTGVARSFSAVKKRGGGDGAVYTVRYRSVDAAGNVEKTRQCAVRIDQRRPETTTDYDGLPHATDLTVNLIGYDAHSGVGETWYSVGGADFVRGTSVLVPAPADGGNDGPHVVAFYSVDNVGNVEAARWVVVTIAAGTP